MAVCNLTDILEDGACFSCLTNYQLELVQAQLLCDILAAGGGGGGGSVAAEGTNYCITGTAPNQVLRIKNTDTGLANAIHADGVDGAQGTHLDDGVAC